YSPDVRRPLGLNGSDPAAASCRARAAGVGGALAALLYLDSKTYLPGDILVKVDRMSMAASLETRAPLLDHKLIEFVCRVPSALKLNGLETKSIFKRAVAGLVPDELLNRPKQGFGVPINQWINDELRGYIRDVLAEAKTRARGYFDPRHVDLLLDEHTRGRRDHSMQLWSLFVLELWHRTFADRGANKP
ncbi:MAG TPA: asparagine synthase C-terminal domain-containing protein, partial [Pyrinomonadaceae bacterium]|nr:asparagine synthase C-terminal domain-containing protein [Pyrinomonadaceae bacterium]